ncbi:MAG: cytochrome c-type biogenesis protein CcmH [Porticoccus sp.]|jgi:cytochrome c-type biogenesis protein CcmH
MFRNQGKKQVSRRLYGTLLILLMAFSWTALALEARFFSSEQLRHRYHTLNNELRCPKCQNQNLADSNSLIAVDLRDQVYLMLEAGKSDDDIVSFLVARYGDFVTYRPPLKAATFALWFAPGALFLVGLTFVFFIRRSRLVENHTVVKFKASEQLHLEELLMETHKNRRFDSDGASK